MEQPIYLGDRKLLCRLIWGGRVVVPSYNVDVAIGAARDGVIEPWTTRLVQEVLRPGDVAVNVGANFGYYTVLAGQIVGHAGRVIAVEANPHILPYLLNSVFWSGQPDRTEIYNCAAWHTSGGDVTFHFSPIFLGGGSADDLWNSHPTESVVGSLDEALWDHRLPEVAADENGRIHIGRERFLSFNVKTRALDDICADVPTVNLLHMDIEGAEAFAIKGARKLLDRSPDARIIFEWSKQRYQNGSEEARTAFEEMWGWLQEHGFRVRRLESRLAENGGIFLTEPVTFDYLANHSDGDFIALRPHNDPWG